MRDKSTLGLFLASLILITILLSVWKSFCPPPQASQIGTFVCGLVSTLERFQTMLAAIIALGAAWWAAAPVWEQLKGMKVQQDISARDIIAKRLVIIEQRFNKDISDLERYEHNIIENTHEENEDLEFHAEMIKQTDAFGLMQWGQQISTSLNKLIKSRILTNSMEIEYLKVIVCLDDLVNTLNEIAVDSHVYDETTNTEIEELNKLADLARINVEEEIWKFIRSVKELKSKGDFELNMVRNRIRQIDDKILLD